MSFRRTVAALVLVNFVIAMGLIYVTRVYAHPPKSVKYHHITHQERLAARPGPARFAIMDDYIRDTLAADWDAHSKDTVIMERAFCLKWQYDLWAGEKAWRVTQISRPVIVYADAGSIQFMCPKGPHTAQVHVHPPQTCADENGGDCWNGGPYAWQCLPSDQDKLYLRQIGEPFGLIQCTREGIVTFYPAEKRPPTAPPPVSIQVDTI